MRAERAAPVIPPALKVVLETHDQVCTTADLSAAGVTPRQLRDLVSAGELVRIRPGGFVHGPTWREVAPWRRHLMRAQAVIRSLRQAEHRVLSHHSALSLQGIALYGVDDRVHLSRTDPGRSEPHATVPLHAAVPDIFIREVRGCRVVAAELACLQVAATFGVEAGLVSAESGLYQKVFDVQRLQLALTALGPVTGRANARRVAELAGPLSESAGESRCRWLFLLLGLPGPVQQVWIKDAEGSIGRVDFLFERERVIVEFDGLGKYQGPEDLRAEKLREDRLRRAGYEVVRLTWADLAVPVRVAERIRTAMERSRSRASA